MFCLGRQFFYIQFLQISRLWRHGRYPVKIPLKEIRLELVLVKIQTHPVYNLPPTFQDKYISK